MRWEGREESQNVEDRRRMPRGGGMAIGGGVGGIIFVILFLLLGGDPRALLDPQQNPNVAQQFDEADRGNDSEVDPNDPLAKFSSVVLKDTEDVWHQLAPQLNQVAKEYGLRRIQYTDPTMVLYRDGTRTACGSANSAVGPFYCPGDSKLYLDLSFFQELQERFRAPGDFAMAYVIAHEVGHHVQHQLGLSEMVQRKQQELPRAEGNEWSVRLELQADYLAGVWAHHAQRMKNILERGDLEEALNAASRIGDDVLQKEATGRVRPDAFTHGSAKQRVRWLRAGMTSGDLSKMMAPMELPYEDL